ncbi:MAG: class I SAM-dependent methyltransferase [Candidatus Puniceispirillales bacterium]|jgi:cyclopropane-fatty-acyl-phospholipid synthase|tara:strand:+ start:1728 stop:2900 length:1173 start_codon:yes stop_codon:yes gene_type:complete
MNFWEILLLKGIKKFSYGSIQIEFSDGYIENIKAKKPGPKAMLKINKPNAAKEIIQGGSVAFAESYINKDISTDNLTNLIHYCALNNDQAESTFNISILKKIIHKVFHYKNKNTKNQAKKNISFHYDLGNKFYEYWLDKTMTYSSAIFNNKSIELEAAQNNKYKKLAELSAIKNGDQILEIGCGWGGFAEFIGNNYDCNLTAVTISREQYEYTKKRIFDANLSHKIEVLLCDYRNITGKFDKIVSIEMFEAVGKQYWNTFFKKIENILKPKGSISLQLITIDDNIYDVYKTNPDFIQKYIFPGGMLPSDKILKELINKTSLKINSIDSFSKDYAKTLNIWNKEFNKKWDKIEKLGFDENFKLLWNYYLSYCEGGFLSKNIDLKQIKLSLD